MNHKKRTFNALLAVLLSFSMGTAPVRAEEDSGIPGENTSETEEGTELPEPSEESGEPVLSEDPKDEEEISEGSKETPDIPGETAPQSGEAAPLETETSETPEESETAEPKEEHEAIGEEEVLFPVPKGFEVSESDRLEKAVLREKEVPASVENMTPGVDYTENELLLTAEEEAYARAAAEIYHGTLAYFEYGIGKIILSDPEISVKSAVLASIEEEELPLVEPNYITVLEPAEEERFSEEEGVILPSERDYSDWVWETFTDPDPNLRDPSSETYLWYLDDIGAYAGWNATMGSSSVRVAVIDTSINENHEELTGKVTSYDVGKGLYYGNGHGTAMAGIIAASADNGKGGAGIAPNVKILGINVFYKSPTTGRDVYQSETLALAINKAIEEKAWIISMSLGSPVYSAAEAAAIKRAYEENITVVASAGNDNTNMKRYPSSHDTVISVGATDRNRMKDYYSNYGPFVTVSAPGSNFYAPVTTSARPSDTDYDWTSGTSPAAAAVSGALALYMSKNGKIKPEESMDVVKKYTEKCSSSGMGSGVINIGKMFGADTEAPSITIYDKNDNPIDPNALKTPVGEGSYAIIYNNVPGNLDTILYTADGTKPAVKNGEVIRGNVYVPGTRIELDSFEKNTTVKLTALVVNSRSVAGKSVTAAVKTPVPAPAAVKIKTLKLAQSRANIDVSAARGLFGRVTLAVSKLIDANHTEVPLSSVKHQWTSSNPAVAAVDSNGCVTAVSAGSAKITLRILDGSNKSASCSVTVSQLAENIVIEGQNAIAPGGSAVYKAVFSPDKTKTKKAEWSLSTPVRGVTISKTGTVKVDSKAEVNTSFTIAAKTLDGSEITVQKTVVIAPKASAIAMDTSDARAVRGKNNVLKSAVIFTADLGNTGFRDNEIELTSKITGSGVPPRWTSSNPKVAVVDQNGRVTARSAGNAKITAETTDGSKKKASVTITVRIPVSSMTFNLGYNTAIGYGKSLDLSKKLAFGTTYGKPTVTKADWTITKVSQEDTDITEAVLAKKLITVKNGKVSVSSSIEKLYPLQNGLVFFDVTAASTDGSGQKAACQLAVLPVASKTYIFDLNGNTSSTLHTDKVYTFVAFCDQPATLEISSGNPSVAGAVIGERQAGTWLNPADGKLYFGFLYPVTVITYDKTGSAKLTVKALDGSNKSGSMTVSVRKSPSE